MSDIAITVENLSKRYRIGAQRGQHNNLGEVLVERVQSFFRHQPPAALGENPALKADDGRTLWALKNVSMEIEAGEVVGFIGRNGAGKSTLLKVLSRITEPSQGRVKICGRIGTLLEVGAGFHGELTGRENVYLSGAVLGMKKREIESKFDEIVDFAGVERFMETPVKRYSSGMYVRLAFAVAAHLDPDILIVDEVLAVGDAAFRLKCLDKMDQIRKQGRTILFVSHNVDALTRMCERVFLLDAGQIVTSGSPTEVLPQYLATAYSISAEKSWGEADDAPGNEIVRLRRVRVLDSEGITTGAQDIRCPVGIEVQYDVLEPGHILIPNYHFFNDERVPLFVVQDVFGEWKRRPREVGAYTSTAWLPGNFLAEGQVSVDVAISSHIPSTRQHALARHAVGFQVIDSHDGDSARGDYTGQLPGVVRPRVEWTTHIYHSHALSITAADYEGL